MNADQPSSTRRHFMATSAAAASVAGLSAMQAAVGDALSATTSNAAQPSSSKFDSDAMREFLKPYVLRSESLDAFFDPTARVWAKFHPTYGYLLRNSFVRDGQDGSFTLARYEPTGQRQQVNFRDQPCRINTYGNSFTQGHQVSDGETWQEILAAHFCEPIRNFGIGGFGVYQAAMRLLEMEATELAAEYLIFNIWGDDHFRSIYSWRWLAFPQSAVDAMSGLMFHANPWVHGRLDMETGELTDRPNLCPDEASVRRLCDLDFVYDTFAGDEVVQLMMAGRTGKIVDPEQFRKTAAMLDEDAMELTDATAVGETAKRLLHRYGVRVGMKVMDRVHKFAESRGKKLLVLLSYPSGSVWHACNGTEGHNSTDNVDWHPREFKEFLQSKKIPYVDSLPKHVAEFQTFRLSAKQYVDRYYIGHYTPRGNHFFAYAVKDELLSWLDPAPPAYQENDKTVIRFKGYLPG